MAVRIRKTLSLNSEQLQTINKACSIRFKNDQPDPNLMLVLLLERCLEIIGESTATNIDRSESTKNGTKR